MSSNKRIIIATGGTGGHIFPAIGLANYLAKVGFDPNLTTDKRGLKFINKRFVKNAKIINSSSLNKNKIISIFKIEIILFLFKDELLITFVLLTNFLFINFNPLLSIVKFGSNPTFAK